MGGGRRGRREPAVPQQGRHGAKLFSLYMNDLILTTALGGYHSRFRDEKTEVQTGELETSLLSPGRSAGSRRPPQLLRPVSVTLKLQVTAPLHPWHGFSLGPSSCPPRGGASPPWGRRQGTLESCAGSCPGAGASGQPGGQQHKHALPVSCTEPTLLCPGLSLLGTGRPPPPRPFLVCFHAADGVLQDASPTRSLLRRVRVSSAPEPSAPAPPPCQLPAPLL